MNPIALPGIFIITIVAAMSFLGAAVVSKRWMRRTAVSLGIFEVGLVLFLVFVGVYYR